MQNPRPVNRNNNRQPRNPIVRMPNARRNNRGPVHENPAPPAPAAPKAALAPAQPAQAPVAENQPSRVGYARSARLWKPRLPPQSNAWSYYRARWHTEPDVPKGAVINSHALQAMERSCTIVEVLAYMYEQGIRRVLNVYADVRESKFNATFNRQRLSHETEMFINRYCPVVVPKDHTRHPTDQPWHTLIQDSEAVLFVDIYHQHHTATMNFDAQYVADCLLQLPNGHHRASAYWIGRKFYGDAGVIPEKYDGKSYAEGAWMRVGNKISYRASEYESSEYNHDPCDWIWAGRSTVVDGRNFGRFYLNWTELRVIGSIHVIHFSLSMTGGLVEDSPLYAFEENLLALPVPASVGWRGWMQSFVPQNLGTALGINETIRVYKPLLEGPLAHSVLRRKVQYNLTSITNRLTSALLLRECAVFYGCFKRCSPANDLHRIALAVQVYNIDATTQNLISNSAQNGAIQTVYNTTLSNVGAAPSSDHYTMYRMAPVAALVVGGVFLYAKYRKLKTRSFCASIVDTYRTSKLTENGRTPSIAATLIAEHLLAGNDIPEIVSTLVQRIRWRPLLSKYLLSCVLSSFGEECFKRCGQYFQPDSRLSKWIDSLFTHIIPVVELFFSVYVDPTAINVIMRLFVFVLHYRWRSLPFWQGVAEHYSWNTFSFFYEMCSDDESFNYHFGFASLFSLFHTETPMERRKRQAILAAKIAYHKVKRTVLTVQTAASAIMSVARPQPVSYFKRFAKVGAYTLLCAGLGAFSYYLYQRKEIPIDKYAEWRETYYQEDWEDIPEPQMDVEAYTAPVTTFTVPMSRTSSVPTRPDQKYEDRGMKINGPWLPDISGPQQYFHHILPTCVPTYVAQKTYSNLNSAVSARVLVLTPTKPLEQLEAWRFMRDRTPYFRIFLDAVVDEAPEQVPDTWNDVVDEWVEHMTKTLARNRYRRIVNDIRTNSIPFQVPANTPIFVKNNEALMQCKDGKMALKPRIICNVNPLFSAFVGPHIYFMQKQLSNNVFPVRQNKGTEFTINGRTFIVTIHYAGAALDSDLTEWAANVLKRSMVPLGFYGLSIMVSGDDSLVVAYTPDSYTVIEGDASMFDITQSSGPLEHEMYINVAFGVPKHIAEAIYQETHAPMALFPCSQHPDLDPMFIDRSLCPTRPSGGTNTSTGNGCIMAQTWVAVMVPLLFTSYTLEHIEQSFAGYGFKMKLKMFQETMNGPTFLKGMWYPTMSHGHVWAPLPSRFLKVGKAIPNPVELYGEKDLKTACAMYLHDVACSFSPYMRIPLMDAFVDTYKKGDELNERKTGYQDPTNPFKIIGSGQYRDAVITDEAYVMLQERYGIDKASFSEATVQILDSTPLTFLSHPTYVALWKADYA